MIPRMIEKYRTKVAPGVGEKCGIKNVMALPKLEKIVINMGLGKAVAEPKMIEVAVSEMTKIAGQKPMITRARKAIANFKLREGMPIGCMVTLRDVRMYEFMDRLINVALPRVRDFKGISRKGFDRQGNYTLGIKDHTIFPEIDVDEVDKSFGMNITFVISGNNDDHSREMLAQMGMPFRQR